MPVIFKGKKLNHEYQWTEFSRVSPILIASASPIYSSIICNLSPPTALIIPKSTAYHCELLRRKALPGISSQAPGPALMILVHLELCKSWARPDRDRSSHLKFSDLTDRRKFLSYPRPTETRPSFLVLARDL
jgi:hypothetical protein